MITNMLGQEVLNGNLVPGTQHISIGGLAAGSYIMNLYKGGAGYGNHVFVKNQ